MLKSGFQPNIEVTDPNLLFGQNGPNGLLDHLVSKLQLGTNIQILGERRIGKTSALKCAAVNLLNKSPRLLPIYINYRQHGNIKGYDNAHRLLLAYIHASIVQYLPSFVEIAESKFGFERSNNAKLVFGLLEAASIHEVERYIEQYIDLLNEHNYGVILLFDEYESMMTSTFEGVSGSFFFIRDLSAKGPVNSGHHKPLTYLISGSTSWNHLCERFGSPEFNNTSEILYVSPIEEKSFSEMWQYCLETSSESIKEKIASAVSDPSEIYRATGGWPYYSKIAGQIMASQGVYDETSLFETLSQNFAVSWNRILDDKQEGAFLGQQNLKPSVVRDLKKRGLAEQDSQDNINPRGSLWSKFVAEQVAELSTMLSDAKTTQETNIGVKIDFLAQEVVERVMTVNETCDNHKREMIFQPTNEDIKIYTYLRTFASSRKIFAFFAAGLYLLIFERTISLDVNKRVHRLGRLPTSFQKSHSLVQEVDALRHEYANAHLTHVPTWNPGKDAVLVADVLEKYLGSKATPTDEQFGKLQHDVLLSLKTYLDDLNTHLTRSFSTKP